MPIAGCSSVDPSTLVLEEPVEDLHVPAVALNLTVATATLSKLQQESESAAADSLAGETLQRIWVIVVENSSGLVGEMEVVVGADLG